MARFYTFLFVILPRKYQWKLWHKLADKHGYMGMCFGSKIFFVGTKVHYDDLYVK